MAAKGTGGGSFELRYTFTVSAAHQIPGYPQPLHGHNFTITVAVEGRELDRFGFLLDFYQLGEICERVRSKLDHRNLNEVDFFRHHPPSAENLARYVAGEVARGLPDKINLCYVEVEEVAGFSVCYRLTEGRQLG